MEGKTLIVLALQVTLMQWEQSVSGEEMRNSDSCIIYVASTEKGSLQVVDGTLRVSDLCEA